MRPRRARGSPRSATRPDAAKSGDRRLPWVAWPSPDPDPHRNRGAALCPFAPTRPAERSPGELYTRTDASPPAETVCPDDYEHCHDRQEPNHVSPGNRNYETNPFSSYNEEAAIRAGWPNTED
jgi:hypothetical protein